VAQKPRGGIKKGIPRADINRRPEKGLGKAWGVPQQRWLSEKKKRDIKKGKRKSGDHSQKESRWWKLLWKKMASKGITRKKKA